MWTTIKMLAATAMLLVAGLAHPAVAQSNIVTNGGFESGDFTGFILNGDQRYVGVAPASSAPLATIGNYRAYFGTVGGTSGIDQFLNTTPGQNYTISFFLENDGGTPNSAQVMFGNTVLLTLTDATAFPLTQFSYNAVASGTSTDLGFSFRQDPHYYNLDGISVVASSAVPELGTWAMMITGMGAIGFALRSAKRRSDEKFDDKIKRITQGALA